ncbi:UNVERIFIED_CONTAM: hypothetical protein GTU68_013334 [Idotea baltica]|nr:hypothetical protein [Idotea baltica]
MKRKRVLYFLLIILTIILGLGSRKFGEYLPEFIATYAGDTLYTFMIYLGIGWLISHKSSQWVFLFAIGFSYLIEFGQFYHAPWIDAIRDTTIGGLILGFSFLWSDLICYTVGALMGWGMERAFPQHLFHAQSTVE